MKRTFKNTYKKLLVRALIKLKPTIKAMRLEMFQFIYSSFSLYVLAHSQLLSFH